MREIKFRAWVKSENCYMGKWSSTQHPTIFSAVNEVAEFYGDDDLDVQQYTGLKDKNGGKEIYEYDIIDGGGNTIGNYHETPELLKDKTNLLIQGFGTKTWLTTYQEAVERGCHDA